MKPQERLEELWLDAEGPHVTVVERDSNGYPTQEIAEPLYAIAYQRPPQKLLTSSGPDWQPMTKEELAERSAKLQAEIREIEERNGWEPLPPEKIIYI